MRTIASRMSVRSGEGALSVFARARELERQGRSIIHLELGEPDFHPGPSVIESAGKALAEGKDRYCAVAGVAALREEIAAYLHRTRNLTVSAENIVIAPGCKIALFLPPDGAFYAWVDITDTGMKAEEICRALLEDGGVAAIPGAAFGPSGKDFVRFSFASSVANLKEAVDRIMKVSTAWQGTLAGQ